MTNMILKILDMAEAAYIPILSLLAIFLLFINYKTFQNQFRYVKKQTYIYLLIIFIAGVYIRLKFSPTFDIYNSDIEGYRIIAKDYFSNPSIIWTYKNPLYPFILAIYFKAFSLSLEGPAVATLIFGSMSIIMIFIMTYIMFKDEKLSLISAIIISLLPTHVFYSGTSVPEIIAMFFAMAVLSSFFVALENRNLKICLFTYTLFLIAVLAKRENIIIIPVMAFALILIKWKEINRSILKKVSIKQVVILATAILIAAPTFHELHKQVNAVMGYLATSNSTVVSNLSHLSCTNTYFLLFVPFLFFIPKNRNSKKLAILIIWLALSYAVIGFHMYYTGRFSVLTYVPWTILISYGVSTSMQHFIKKIHISLLIAVLILPSLLTFSANTKWYEQHKTWLFLESSRSNDKMLVDLVKPYAQNSDYLLITSRQQEALLFKFIYSNATIINVDEFLNRGSLSSFKNYENVYFLKYKCDMGAKINNILIENTKKYCDKLENLSKETIVKTKIANETDVEIRRL